jgi:transposase
LETRINEADAVINKTAGENEACRRLVAIPGIGPVTATAIIAAIGNGAAFRKGREFAAWLGVVPREYSTGGKQRLLGISKRGNSYLRRLFVQGARAVLQQSAKQSSGLSAWLAQLTSRTHRNVAGVALANKLARMAWAVLAKNENIGPQCWPVRLQRDWPPDDAWLRPGLEIAFAIPHLQRPAATTELMISARSAGEL